MTASGFQRTEAMRRQIRKEPAMNRTTEHETMDPYRLKLHLTPPLAGSTIPTVYANIEAHTMRFISTCRRMLWEGAKMLGACCQQRFNPLRDEGIFLEPDRPFDRDGVYSGCAWTDENGIHLFYTGNVKEAGDYDYIREGRRAAQVLVETKDGKEAGEKRLLLTNKDYPEDCTLHIRDPKVWKEAECTIWCWAPGRITIRERRFSMNRLI